MTTVISLQETSSQELLGHITNSIRTLDTHSMEQCFSAGFPRNLRVLPVASDCFTRLQMAGKKI